MNRKLFFKKFIVGLAGIATVPIIASKKEPEVEITGYTNHFKYISADPRGYKSYVCDGIEVHFTVDGKDLMRVLKNK